jgi:hypothetical protein
MYAESALFHHVGRGIELGHPVGAGPGAIPTADAAVLVDENDAILLALGDGSNRACRLACRFASVHAGHGHEIDAQIGLLERVGEFAFLDLYDPVEVNAHGSVVFGLACHRTGMTPDAVFEVHPDGVLFWPFFPKRPLLEFLRNNRLIFCHGLSPLSFPFFADYSLTTFSGVAKL